MKDLIGTYWQEIYDINRGYYNIYEVVYVVLNVKNISRYKIKWLYNSEDNTDISPNMFSEYSYSYEDITSDIQLSIDEVNLRINIK
jgi:hypothetical protein